MIILAAGLSKRMGSFKPLLPVVAGAAVLDGINISGEAGIGDIIVVTGNMRGEIESVLSANAPGVRIAYNSRFTDGMFSSVKTGVSALPERLDSFFILPADCCAVSADTLKTLIGVSAEVAPEYVVHPKYSGLRGHPPLIPSMYISHILEYHGENGLKGLLDTLPYVESDTDDRGVLLDMDTPEDYRELLEYLESRNE